MAGNAGNAGRGGNGVRNTSVVTHTLPVGARLTTPSQHPQRQVDYNSGLYNPSQTLTGKQLAAAAQQIANLQTQGPIRDYQSQINQNNKNTAGESRTDFNYYMQLAQDAKGLVDQQGQSNAALQSQLQGIAGNQQSQLQQLGQQAQGGAVGRMAALGLGGDAIGQLQAQNAQAQGISAQNAATAQTYGAMTGNNAQSEARSLGAAGGLAGTEQIGALGRANASNNQTIQQKINDEVAQKGTLAATALGQLRTQERDYSIAQQGLQQKGQALNNTIANTNSEIATRGQNANTAAQRARTAAQTARDAQGQHAFNDNPLAVGSPAWQRVQSSTGTQWSNNPNAVGSAAWARVQAATAAKAGGGNKPMTHNENNQWFRALGQVEALAQTMQTPLDQKAAQKVATAIPGVTQGAKLNGAQIALLLKAGNNPAGKSFDPLMIEAAQELAQNGSITPATARLMNQAGLRGGNYNDAPIRVKASGVGPAISNTAAGATGGF